MILRGERQLTLTHVQKLSNHFGVSADLFLP
jgi:antitoxin component HigA of HigAB toxin-antitoxin module